MSLFPPVVYLIRHATPNRATGIRYDVPPGPPLLPQGEAEAAKVGEFLRSAEVQKLYVSPMERTQQTARIAAEAGGDIPWTLEPALIEWTHGDTEETVLARMLTVWEQVWEESTRCGPMGLVGHGGPIRVLVEHLGVDKQRIEHYRKQFDYGNPMPPAGIWRITQGDSSESLRVELIFTPQPFDPYPQGEDAPPSASISYPTA